MVPMVVQLLLELLEKRLPPLENLRVGEKEKSEEEIEAILENTMRNSAASLEAERQSLDQFSTGTLLQVLKSYLKHRCRDVFEPTERFCRLCAIYIHVTESHPSDKRHYVSQELAKVKERMSSRKTVLMARLMQQLLRWCKKQIVYEKDRGSSRSGWEIEDDAKTFLAEVFADSLISISERMHMVIVENGVLISEVDATFDSHYSDHSSDEDDDVKFDKWLKSQHRTRGCASAVF